jgi:fucose permease
VLGHSYRAAMLVVALVVCAQCATSAVLLRTGGRAGSASNEEERAEPLHAALSRAARLPRLWLWLFAAASCTLLDELVIALAALRLEHDQGATAAMATGSAVVFSAGAILGAAFTDRAVAALSRRSVLIASAILCAAALAALLWSGGLVATCVALFAVGVTSAPHHPLAFAGAYRELPDRPGTVQAVAQVFVVIDVLAPLAVGGIADRLGLGAAMSCLLVQPGVILVTAVLAGRDRSAPKADARS